MQRTLTNWWYSLPPAVRLASAYMGIVMAVSVGFSLVLYRISSAEITSQARRPGIIFVPRYDSVPDYSSFREEQLAEGIRRLRQNLFFLNLGTLLVGGWLSYYLAKRTLEPIEEALEAQTRFTGDASHELRTPLTAMQAEIEVALRNPKLGKDDAITLLKSNLEEVGKLRALSDGLLRLARADKNSLELLPVDLKEVGAKAAARVAGLAQSKHMGLDVTLRELAVAGDADSLIEAIVVLLDNAIKYSNPKARVELAMRRQAHTAVIEVIDHGQGISQADLPHIFERFYRADSSRSKGAVDGYGLGLSIAYKIVDLHNGTITAKSTQGKGSTFSIKLPLMLG